MPPRDDEVQTLVEQLSAELDRSVLVDDASLRLLAYSPTLGSDDEVRKITVPFNVPVMFVVDPSNKS